MRRLGIAILVLIGVGAGVVAIFRASEVFGGRTRTVLTDGDGIRVDASSAPRRRVLWMDPVPRGEFDSRADAYEPRLSPDGQSMFLVRGRAGGSADLYVSRRTLDGWSQATPLSELNTESHDELGACPSRDGSRLYFYSDRPGGLGGYDLWVAQREGDLWTNPRNLGPSVNSEYNDYGPAISSRGDLLCFSSNRPTPDDVGRVDSNAWPATVREELFSNDYDLYSSPITERGIGQAIRIDQLCTTANEGSPAISPVGDFLYFSSDRPGGCGGFDLYRARRLGDGYSLPENLGSPVNTDRNELDPTLGNLGFELIFSSDRDVAAPGVRERYGLYSTESREVYESREVQPVDWAGLWSLLWPGLMWLLLVALLLLLLLLLLRHGRMRERFRRLSLLAKCLLVSLLIHMLILAGMTAYRLGTALGRALDRDGGMQIALVSRDGSASIAGQVRGEFTRIEPRVSDESADPLTMAMPVPSFEAERARIDPLQVVRTERELTALEPTEARPRPDAAASAPVLTVVDAAPREAVSLPESPERAVQISEPQRVLPLSSQEVPQENFDIPESGERPAIQAVAVEQRSTSADVLVRETAPEAAGVESPLKHVRTDIEERDRIPELTGLPALPRVVEAVAEQEPGLLPDTPEEPRDTVEIPTRLTRVELDHSPSSPPESPVGSLAPQLDAAESNSGWSSETLPESRIRLFESERTISVSAPANQEGESLPIEPLSSPGSIRISNARAEGEIAPPRIDSNDIEIDAVERAWARESPDRSSVQVRDASPTSPPVRVSALEVQPLGLREMRIPAAAEAPTPAGLPVEALSRDTPVLDDSSRGHTESVTLPRVETERFESVELDPRQNATARSLARIEGAQDALPDQAPDAVSPRRSHVLAMPSPSSSEVVLPEQGVERRVVRLEAPGLLQIDSESSIPTRVDVRPPSPRIEVDSVGDELLSTSDVSRPGRSLANAPVMEAQPDGRSADVVPVGASLSEDASRGASLALEMPAGPEDIALSPEKIAGILVGRVIDAETDRPLAGAVIRLDRDRGETLTTASVAGGEYVFPMPSIADHVAVTASLDGYIPESVDISASDLARGRIVRDFRLLPESVDVVSVEVAPVVHHLGNDEFTGRINSQFQRRAEGIVWTETFEITRIASTRISRRASVVLLAKGTQAENQIVVNGRIVGQRLQGSPDDGSFGEFKASFPGTWLREGENTIEIRSVIGSDRDDFEFVNVRVLLRDER